MIIELISSLLPTHKTNVAKGVKNKSRTFRMRLPGQRHTGHHCQAAEWLAGSGSKGPAVSGWVAERSRMRSSVVVEGLGGHRRLPPPVVRVMTGTRGDP